MCPPVTPADVSFETVLPIIADTAEQMFGAVRCPQTRDDAVAEVVALAWVRFRLAPNTRPAAAHRLACDCIDAVRAGCRFADAGGV